MSDNNKMLSERVFVVMHNYERMNKNTMISSWVSIYLKRGSHGNYYWSQPGDSILHGAFFNSQMTALSALDTMAKTGKMKMPSEVRIITLLVDVEQEGQERFVVPRNSYIPAEDEG